MEEYDYVIVGSGLNSLVCAALLAKQSKKVCVLERDQELGGCIKVDRETAPGFTFDLLSTSHVQFMTSPAYLELKHDLESAGLQYCVNEFPAGVLLPDGRSLVINTDHEKNLQTLEKVSPQDAKTYSRLFEKFFQNANITFSLLGNEPYSWANIRMLCKEVWQRGVVGVTSAFVDLLKPARQHLEAHYQSDEVRALFAPMCLHGGLSPDAAMSSLMGELITFSFSQVADPLVKGGGDKLVEAFKIVIESHGGVLITNQCVEQVLLKGNKAVGIETAKGNIYKARKGVIANVTPQQLYQQLLPAEVIPTRVTEQTHNFQHGRSCMMIHLALDQIPGWIDSEMDQVAFLHITSGIDSISKALNEADRGLLPDRGTICAVQPVTVDPTRAPEGKWILWLQILELPKVIKGDARGVIVPPENGRWTREVSEAYADRIIQLLSEVSPGIEDSIIARRVVSPADLETLNVNLVGGDPYAGHCGLEQSMMFRPFPSVKNHRTPIKQLFHIGASTHPGPGLGGMSGYLLAKSLK